MSLVPVFVLVGCVVAVKDDVTIAVVLAGELLVVVGGCEVVETIVLLVEVLVGAVFIGTASHALITDPCCPVTFIVLW